MCCSFDTERTFNHISCIILCILMTSPAKSIFICPQCGKALVLGVPCACGFVSRDLEGIIDLLPDADAAAFQPFLEIYERVRASEKWGGDDLDLPFHAKRHHDIWNIRKRTFQALQSAISDIARGPALDAGAGNCWLTRYLYKWGFDAIALDINTSRMDGLGAGQTFIDAGSAFIRVRSSMERLPVTSDCIALLVANASLHYACDFRSVLSEFRRVLTKRGVVAIIDTPFYESPDDGERMVADRVADFAQKYHIPESMARRSSYLTYQKLARLAESLDLDLRVQHVWPGAKRKYQEIRGWLAGRRIAQFPVVLLTKK
jgi:ubiquinone/menaquinone biosynthesis C-methylase UbiE